MPRYVAGVYESEQAAEQAIGALMQEHFEPDRIEVLVKNGDQAERVGIDHHTEAGRGAAAGVALGGITAALGATLIATGALAVPGLGLLGTAPVVAALEGAAVGGATGGLGGLLVGLNFWENEANLQAEAIEAGQVWVGVRAFGDRVDEAAEVLERTGAEHIARSRADVPDVATED